MGYESFNPYESLGTVILFFILFFIKVLVTFLILWPISKCGYPKKAYSKLNQELFFRDFSVLVFQPYLGLLFSSFLCLTAPKDDTDYHSNTIGLSIFLLFICTAIVPSILMYVASQPKEKREDPKFIQRFGSIVNGTRTRTIG